MALWAPVVIANGIAHSLEDDDGSGVAGVIVIYRDVGDRCHFPEPANVDCISAIGKSVAGD
jgi:hypothetical protein